MAFVRYQTVRNVGIGVLGAGAIAGIVVAATGPGSPPLPKEPPARVATPSPSPSPSPAAALDDAAIVARADQPATPGEKIKDAFKGNPTKVNLYEETNDRIYDRLKIDTNRDDTWDIQWNRTPGGPWQREDGATFVGGAWHAAGGDTAAKDPAVDPPIEAGKVEAPPATTDPHAEQLALVLKTMLQGKAKGGKLKDLFRGSGPKVNLYDDNNDGQWDRAKIDYERDEIDDEKLMLKGGILERKNEKSGVVQVFDQGAWKPKP